jgi:hypothetical protein
LDLPLKLLITLSIVATLALQASPGMHARSQADAGPKFRIEIQAAGDRGPSFTITNLTPKAVTAYVIEISSSSQSKVQSRMVWDALLQNESPIEPGTSSSQHLAYAEGGPFPDKVEVVAGVWADGETFGEPGWVKTILKNRAMRESEYDEAVALLKQGLEENWNRDQYLQALNGKPVSLPTHEIRSSLMANSRNSEKPQQLRKVVQLMLESFTQKSDQLRKAKLAASDGSGL